MKHFFLTGKMLGKKEIIFSGNDFHYLKNVLRLKKGDSLPGIDENGCRYHLMMTRETENTLIAEYEISQIQDKKQREIRLFQCLLKGKKWDTLVRQATEAGVTKIIPVISEFTISKITGGNEKNKLERWRRIVKEAVQQSGRLTIPIIEEPKKIADLKNLQGLSLFFHQDPIDQKPLHRYLSTNPGKINILIGPEGGLSGKETSLLSSRGFLPAYLGDTVLRAETAAIFSIAAIRIILLEKNNWRLP